MYSQLVKKEANLNGEPISRGSFLINKQFIQSDNHWQVTGQWTNEENIKYAKFICENSLKLQGKAYSKLWSVFKDMALMIQTRNFRQCKSHHQKMMEQFGSIKCIADHLGLKMVKNKFKNKIKQQQVENPIIIIGNKPERNPEITFSDVKLFPIQQNNDYLTFSNPQLFVPKQNFGFPNPHMLPFHYNQFPLIVKPLTEEEMKTAHKYQTPEFYFESMLNGTVPNPQMMPTFMNELSQTSLANRTKSSKDKEWLECHRIFILWFNKLAKLTTLLPSI